MPSVLIVENEPEVRAVLSEVLLEGGFEAVAVASADAARGILALDPDRFDVVVTDILMPGENGLDLCRALRAAHFVHPILAISGDGLQLDAASTAGATCCLSKPFGIDDFLNVIRLTLEHPSPLATIHGPEGSPLMPSVHAA